MPIHERSGVGSAAAAVVLTCLVGLTVSACGGVSVQGAAVEERDQRPAQSGQDAIERQRQMKHEKAEAAADREVDKLDRAVEDANQQLERAAENGHRPAATRAERRLTRASRRARAARTPSNPLPKRPFERELARFRYKQGPLFVQQTISTGRHQLLVAVFREQFCLQPPARRLKAVLAVYAPIDARLRRRGINDFEMRVVPPTSSAPTSKRVLASAARGTVRLSSDHARANDSQLRLLALPELQFWGSSRLSSRNST